MTVHEPYMQKSFQLCHCNGTSGDHTHKYSKIIKETNRNGNVFTASCATMSLIRKVTTNHLTFAKSNAEIEPTMKNIKSVRTATKPGDLQRYETDNVNGDAILWESYFKTLTQGTVKGHAQNSEGSLLPDAVVTETEFTYLRENSS